MFLLFSMRWLVKKGGLVISHQNEIADELIHLCQALKNSAVHDKRSILCHSTMNKKAQDETGIDDLTFNALIYYD